MNYEDEAGIYARPESQDQFRSSHRRCSVKKGFLKNLTFHKFHSRTPVLEALFCRPSGLEHQ